VEVFGGPALHEIGEHFELRLRGRQVAFGLTGWKRAGHDRAPVESGCFAQEFGVLMRKGCPSFDDVDALGRVQHAEEDAGLAKAGGTSARNRIEVAAGPGLSDCVRPARAPDGRASPPVRARAHALTVAGASPRPAARAGIVWRDPDCRRGDLFRPKAPTRATSPNAPKRGGISYMKARAIAGNLDRATRFRTSCRTWTGAATVRACARARGPGGDARPSGARAGARNPLKPARRLLRYRFRADVPRLRRGRRLLPRVETRPSASTSSKRWAAFA